MRSQGHDIKVLPFSEWRSLLRAEAEKGSTNPLVPLQSYFDVFFPELGPHGDSNAKEAMTTRNLAWPEITQETIQTYLNFLQQPNL